MTFKLFYAGLAAAALTAVATAAGATPIDLSVSNLNTRAGVTTKLNAGVTYQASGFPIALKITPPDASWGGTQWKTSSHGKPAFGWAAFTHGPVNQPPKGVLEIETAYGPTPTAAVILGRLRTAGGGATFGPTVRVSLAGHPGWQIDGHIFGRFGHYFVPFTPKTGGATPPDGYNLSPGEAFRLVVLDVKGRRVVLFFDSAVLPADQFPTFLAAVRKLIISLRLG